MNWIVTDVKSLFTNIPVDFTANLIRNTFHGLKRTELRIMLNRSCKNAVLQFNENITPPVS